MKIGEYRGHLSEHQLLKKDPASWS